MLPAFAVAGYRGVVIFLLVAAAAGSAVSWWVAWLATRRDDAAWFGWAAVTLPATTVFHSFTVYPDGLGGALALTAVWALLRAEDERRTGIERRSTVVLARCPAVDTAVAAQPIRRDRRLLRRACAPATVHDAQSPRRKPSRS